MGRLMGNIMGFLHTRTWTEIHYLRLKTKVIRLTEKEYVNMLLHVQVLEPTKNDVQTL